MQKMSRQLLYWIVFITGSFTMIFELSGIRLLGPFLGTSIVVWSGTIGVIMASLALGYQIGGKVADRFPERDHLTWTLSLAGFFVLFTALGNQKIILFVLKNISGLPAQTLWSAVLLFIPANFFLGAVLPLSAKLVLRELPVSGAKVGMLYALSTLGSILGTVSGGFLFIPFWGHFAVLLAMAFALFLLAVLWFIARKNFRLWVIPAVFLALGLLMLGRKNLHHKYIDMDTAYNRVIVRETFDRNGKPVRKLFVNNEGSSAMYLDNDSLAFEVLNYYDLAMFFRPGLKHIMMIGGSGYAYPKYFLHHFPDKKIDVVEIDPGLTRIAKTYFRLKDNPRLTIFHEDGRTFLNRSEHRYDAILMDAYKSLLTVPFQLTTLEAIQKIYDNLDDDGIFLANIIGTYDSQSNYFLRAEMKTILNVFPEVKLFAVQYPRAQGKERGYFQNMMLIAFKNKKNYDLHSPDSRIDRMLQHLVKEKFPLDLPVLTDDYAPVEYYTYKALK